MSQTPPDTLNEIGVLKRREIEARILMPVLKRLGAEFGEERVFAVAREVIIEVARAQGRDLAGQMEMDLGTRLDWVAVDHWNTEHPHIHLIVRGVRDDGQDLVIARAYIKEGMRDRARDLITQELGPRTEHDIRRTLERQIAAERWTGLDRQLVRDGRGAGIIDVTLPHTPYAVAVYYLIAPSEASSNLARYDGVHYGHRAERFASMIDMYAATRGEAFGDEVKRRIMLGTYALSAGYYDAYYQKALQVRRLIREDFDRVFAECDVIVSPVTPRPAYRLGELADDPLAMYLEDIYTISANLAGLPALSLPAGFSSDGLPIGVQLLAPPLNEERLLRAARMFERETDWHLRRPSLGSAP